LATKAKAVEGWTTSTEWIYHQCNQAKHVTDGVTVMSLSASLEHKTMRPEIVYAKSRSNEKCRVNSKNGLNLQDALEQNRVKQDLLVVFVAQIAHHTSNITSRNGT